MENKTKLDGYGKASLSLILLISSIIIIGAIFSGCSDSNTVSSNTTPENMSVSVKISDTGLDDPNAAIVISEAKALISEFEIEATDGQSNEIKLRPFIINFDLSSNLKELLSVYIPTKTYKKVKFQIHKPEDNETPSDPDFITGGRYSFIIKGTYNGSPFIFKSKKTVNLILNMNGDVIIGNNKINISMLINKSGWFKNSGGSDLDPRDSGNENEIDDNLKNSFKSVFKDDDKNGIPDGL